MAQGGYGARASSYLPLSLSALLVFAAYYFGAKVGLALTFSPHPTSVLWPPNAILLAALMLAPVRWWWILLAAAFPAHLLAELQDGVPAAMVLCWFVSNASEALIGAVFVRCLMRGPDAFDSLRNVVIFIAGGVLLAPFLSSFLDAGFVTLVGWGQSDYWSVWRTRFFSNILATLTLVPVIVTWANGGIASLQASAPARLWEAIALLSSLLATSIFVFAWYAAGSGIPPALLYLPLPLLLWAAVRFGPGGASTAFMIVALLVIWGAGHGRGPFVTSTPAENVLAVQFFLSFVGITMMVIAAVIQERKSVEQKLRGSEERLATAFRVSPDAMAISRLSDGRMMEVNDRWLAMFGRRREEVIGRPVAEFNFYVNERDREHIEALPERGSVRDVEIEFRYRTGGLLQTILSTEVVDIEGQPCLITIIRDITERRRTEMEMAQQRSELAHLSRVAMLGELSGSLAHELNQPLSAILANAQAAQRFLARNPASFDEIDDILKDIVADDKRAGEVIRRLRVLFKKEEMQHQSVDVNEVVQEVMQLMRSELMNRRVSVITRLAPDLPRVKGDRVHLQQVLVNLIINGADAMEGIELERRTSPCKPHWSMQVPSRWRSSTRVKAFPSMTLNASSIPSSRPSRMAWGSDWR